MTEQRLSSYIFSVILQVCENPIKVDHKIIYMSKRRKGMIHDKAVLDHQGQIKDIEVETRIQSDNGAAKKNFYCEAPDPRIATECFMNCYE